MAQIGNLEVRLGIDAGSFNAGIRNAADKLDQLEGATGKAGRSISAFGGKMAAAGGVMTKFVSGPLLAAGAGALAFANKFASAADATAKHADKIGIATDALQELRFSAERSGIAAGTLDTGLQRLVRRTGEAAKGTGTLAKVLEEYGISAVDAEGNARGAEEMLAEIAGAMQRAGSEGEQLRIAIAAFDTEGAGMVNMLRDGTAGLDGLRDAARDAGAVISEDALRSSEQFADNMLDLQTKLAATTNAIGAALIPAFNDLMPVLIDKVIPGIAAVAEHVASAITWFAQLPGPVQEAAGIVAAAFAVGGPVLMALGFFAKAIGALVLATGPIGLFIAAATLAYIAWQKWGDQITELVGTVIEWLRDTFTAFSEGALAIWQGLGQGIVDAFMGPLNSIQDMVGNATGAIGDFFQGLADRLVFGSIVPDMFDALEIEFGRMQNLVDMSERAAGAIDSAWSKSSANTTKNIHSGTTEALGLLGTFFKDSKAIAIAQAVANTWLGVSETLAKYPWPVAGVMAALHAAAGLKAVASLRSTNVGGGGGGGGGARSIGGGSVGGGGGSQLVQTFRVEGLQPGSFVQAESIIDMLDQAARRGLRPEFAQ